MNENRTINKAMLGDVPSLEKLIGGYYDTIYAFCCRRTGDPSTGADACQETFLSMVRNLPKYRERGYFKSWLFAIASNCCNDVFRKKRPLAELNEDLPDANQAFESRTGNALLIKSALAQLPGFQAEAVILRYYHDCTIGDIARIQHIPVGTAKTRLHRSLQKLRKILGEEILLET